MCVGGERENKQIKIKYEVEIRVMGGKEAKKEGYRMLSMYTVLIFYAMVKESLQKRWHLSRDLREAGVH